MTAIYPGEKAPQPFVDYARKLNGLSAAEKANAVGTSVARLVRSGLIGWGDTVGDHGAKSLASIVAARHLTLKKLLKAGIPAWIAKRAIEQSKGEPEPEPRPGFLGRVGHHARRILHRFTGLFGGPTSPPSTPATTAAPATAAPGTAAGAAQAAGFSAALGAIRPGKPNR